MWVPSQSSLSDGQHPPPGARGQPPTPLHFAGIRGKQHLELEKRWWVEGPEEAQLGRNITSQHVILVNGKLTGSGLKPAQQKSQGVENNQSC